MKICLFSMLSAKNQVAGVSTKAENMNLVTFLSLCKYVKKQAAQDFTPLVNRVL